ncbi:hypothetical protein [Methylobacterium durans]|uniref:Uncharacterized protein n=1 Tax=Methylobacterium durans TaxID=2202825 RepID=A0A2U8WFU9_9HYPH|nr:hypothetical protein [Methylobacterium durans]AWN44401.1 hypothetical protein DK389_06650 [Methylobacterium durans]
MKVLLASSVLAAGLLAAVPASAQSIEVGPGGPSVDLRSRGQRERDIDREETRRDIDRGGVRRERREIRRGPGADDDDDDED